MTGEALDDSTQYSTTPQNLGFMPQLLVGFIIESVDLVEERGGRIQQREQYPRTIFHGGGLANKS